MPLSGTRQKQTGRQVLLPTAFRQPLTADSNRAKVMTNATEYFYRCGYAIYLLVENTELKHMVRVFEPRFMCAFMCAF